MRWGSAGFLLTTAVLFACSRDAETTALVASPQPIAIRAILPLPHEPLGAIVQHDAETGTFVRAAYTGIGDSAARFTPWKAPDSAVVVLGFEAGQTYSIRMQLL